MRYTIRHSDDHEFRRMLELIADTRRDLVAVQLLLEPDDAEIQDRNRIRKGLGLVLRVSVFEPCKPVVREGVVETRSDRPTHARIIATDCDAGRGDRGLVRNERGATRHIEQSAIRRVAEPPADRAAPFAVRGKEITGDCGVTYLAHQAQLAVITPRNSVAKAILVRSRRDDERRPQQRAPAV